ncbi:MAG: hypothetical protein EZS28_053007, partial [Streblomastix strix]
MRIEVLGLKWVRCTKEDEYRGLLAELVSDMKILLGNVGVLDTSQTETECQFPLFSIMRVLEEITLFFIMGRFFFREDKNVWFPTSVFVGSCYKLFLNMLINTFQQPGVLNSQPLPRYTPLQKKE